MPASRRSSSGSSRGKPKRSVSDASVSTVRGAARRISELYGGGESGRLLADRYAASSKVEAILQRRHRRGVARGIGEDGFYRRGKHEWKVPLGVRLCLKRPLLWVQIANRYPWKVTWVSPKTGQRKYKRFSTAVSAIDFIATKAQYVDKHAGLISRQVGYDIPSKLRGKIPRPWRWCPYCMTARKFTRRGEETFFALRKEWSKEKERFVRVERKLAVIECSHCLMTNQDPRWRRSNQPWEVRHIKQGVRRLRKHRKVRREA